VPIGDRRTKDQLSEAQRAYNREQARLRALVEQAIGHLANAWALRRWRGLLYRVREVFRAAGALVCLGRWLPRVPTTALPMSRQNSDPMRRGAVNSER